MGANKKNDSSGPPCANNDYNQIALHYPYISRCSKGHKVLPTLQFLKKRCASELFNSSDIVHPYFLASEWFDKNRNRYRIGLKRFLSSHEAV